MTVAVQNLTKTYGARTVVDDLSFDLEPGQVVGFLGPNGSGKSTTMKMMLGLARPDQGSVSWDGSTYAELDEPMRMAGALLDAQAIDPARSARDHLRVLATCAQLPPSRVDDVLELTGMTSVADENIGGFSLGMHQRIGIAAALLGDPKYLLFDEPSNGLDPEGIHWQRDLFRDLAAEGRGVLVSSHLLAELAHVVDHLVVIGKGKLISQTSIEAFTSREQSHVRVRSPRSPELAQLLVARQLTIEIDDGALLVSGTTAALVGDLAAAEGIALHELTTETVTLEQAFLTATAGAQEYRSGTSTTEASP